MADPKPFFNLWNTFASFTFVWAIISRYCPVELRRYLQSYTHRLMSIFYPYIVITVHEFNGSHLSRSEAYNVIETYLSAFSLKTAKKLKAEMGDKKITLSMDEHERVTDTFNGAEVTWISSKVTSHLPPMSLHPEPERRLYRLKFHQRDREMITEAYLEHVLKEGKEIKQKNRQRKLYTNSSSSSGVGTRVSSRMWSHVRFEPPATFETMAMDPEKKQEIIEDLLAFSESKDFYARIGKAWKRGYLLYGPPGTGKSTMIAAMANLLSYDVYDLELTAVKDNTELRKLLIDTTSKSIIVIEDIDCSLDLTGQRKKKEEKPEEGGKAKKKILKELEDENSINNGNKVTLSGLLNFIDGLWSSCGGERIIVFTTNYVEKLDPALTRRGRMDKHIELSYCSFEGFKLLAKNYLEIEEHQSFDLIRQLMGETKITPADIAENLMPKTAKMNNADVCLSNLILALEEAKKETKQNEPEKMEAKLSDKQEAT